MGESIYQNGNEVHTLLEAIVELELWKREKAICIKGIRCITS